MGLPGSRVGPLEGGGKVFIVLPSPEKSLHQPAWGQAQRTGFTQELYVHLGELHGFIHGHFMTDRLVRDFRVLAKLKMK